MTLVYHPAVSEQKHSDEDSHVYSAVSSSLLLQQHRAAHCCTAGLNSRSSTVLRHSQRLSSARSAGWCRVWLVVAGRMRLVSQTNHNHVEVSGFLCPAQSGRTAGLGGSSRRSLGLTRGQVGLWKIESKATPVGVTYAERRHRSGNVQRVQLLLALKQIKWQLKKTELNF